MSILARSGSLKDLLGKPEYSSGSALSFSNSFINNVRELRHGVSSKFLVKHPLDRDVQPHL